MLIKRWEAPDGRDRYIHTFPGLTGLRVEPRWMQTAPVPGRLVVRGGLVQDVRAVQPVEGVAYISGASFERCLGLLHLLRRA
jgi:hypothetical protein